MHPPPFPAFLAILPLILVNVLLLCSNNLVMPPPCTVFLTQTIIILMTIPDLLKKQPLIARLFPALMPGRNVGRDVWTLLEIDPRTFWYLTGETPRSLEQMVRRVAADVVRPRLLPRQPTTRRQRACLLDVRNRVLLVIIWLRCYHNYHAMANLFHISTSTVAEEIYHIVPILYLSYRHLIRWHNLQQWAAFLGNWPHFPNAVGSIDATSHKINRPSVGQAEFYRGDKKFHFMSTQLVVDADGLIVMLVSGLSVRLGIICVIFVL